MANTPTKIQLEINDCQDCPFCESQRHWTSDSWEHAYDYYCKKKETGNKEYPSRKIAGYIEWRSEMPEVPHWCPLSVEKPIKFVREEAGKYWAIYADGRRKRA